MAAFPDAILQYQIDAHDNNHLSPLHQPYCGAGIPAGLSLECKERPV